MMTLTLVMVAAAGARAQTPLDDAGYWRFVDGLQPMFDRTWREDDGVYRLGSGGIEPTGNAGLLIVHSVAALRGHQGPARQDARASRMVEALFESPPYTATLPPTRKSVTQRHAPGWVGSLHDLGATQHMVIDAEIMDGLAYAWRARRALGLSPRARRLIARRVPAVARSRFFRWPSRTLNQINWQAAVYSADARITGSSELLRSDLRKQIARFIANVRGRGGAAGNLAAGLSFHYLPDSSPDVKLNVDSAEYASIVASFTRFYGFARRRGMAPPSAAGRGLLRQWLLRVVTGYWTHAGYLNWDTGYGFRRWHHSKKIGLAQQALVGIAATPELAGPRVSRWAKWMLDRGFEFYARQAARNDGIAPQWLFGVDVLSLPDGNRWLGAARMAGNAARAIAAAARAGAGGAAARAVLVRSGDRPARHHHAGLQHRRRAGQPGRVPVRRDRARAALRRGAGRRREHRRSAAGGVRAAGQRSRGRAGPGHPDGGARREPPPARCASHGRPRASACRPGRPHGARTPARSRTCARPAGCGRRRWRRAPRTASRPGTSRRAGRSRDGAAALPTRSACCSRATAPARASMRCGATEPACGWARARSACAASPTSTCAARRAAMWWCRGAPRGLPPRASPGPTRSRPPRGPARR